MKTIAKFVVPAALALAAFGVQAQTVETDYPLVRADGKDVVTVKAPASTGTAQTPLYLVQSNFEGPTANPAQIRPSSLSRGDVRANARVNVQWNPADLS